MIENKISLDKARRPFTTRPAAILALALLFLLGLIKQSPEPLLQVESLIPALTGAAGAVVQEAERLGVGGEALLIEGMPAFGAVNSDLVYETRRRLLTFSFYTLTRVDMTDLRTFFSFQLPVSAMETGTGFNPADPEMEGPILEPLENEPTEQKPSTPTGAALVGIYNSHSSESYLGDGGPHHESAGKMGEIMQVASELARSLEKQGIPVARSEKIHDVPKLEEAYSHSIVTADQMVKANSKLQTLIDVHRDGVPEGNKKRVVTAANQQLAPVLIVLGMKHGNWQKNDEFAKQLLKKGNEMYPGLFLPIHYATEARYNQHLHPHAILLEFGDQYNTTEEADRSAQAVAQVLAKILNP